MNIVVIGLGSMGKRRIRLMKGIYPKFQIYGVDCNIDRVLKVAKEFKISCYQSIDDIPLKNKIKCAFVCTTPLAHGWIITDCLNRGFHIFTEINLVDTRYKENILLAEERRLLLFLSSTPIYRAEMQEIKNIVEKQNEPVHYIYHVGQYLPDWHPWENYKDFFVNDKKTNGCREIFAIELPWMSKAFSKIQHMGQKTISGKMTKLQIDYDDNYIVSLNHENGSSGIFIVDVVCRHPVRSLEIYNESMYLRWNGTPKTLEMKNLEKNEMETISIEDNYTSEIGYSTFINEEAYVNEIIHFFEVLEHGNPMKYSFEEDQEILNIIDQIEGTII